MDTGQLFYSYGLIPSVLMGHDQLPMDFYVVPAYVTIFSSMFMHGGFMHLIGNMLYMWIFADNIEDNLGPRNFIIFYLLSGIGAAMAQVLMDTHSQIPNDWGQRSYRRCIGSILNKLSKCQGSCFNTFWFF